MQQKHQKESQMWRRIKLSDKQEEEEGQVQKYLPPDKIHNMGWSCKECENEFTNVDLCTSYYCIECTKMTEKEYKVLHRPDCLWRCPTCTIENEENKHWEKERVREIKVKLEGKIMALEKRMDEN